MGVILELPRRAPAKYGHQKVRKQKKQRELERAGQMNLFASSARILAMPSYLSPFEEALLLDERGNDEARRLYQAAIEVGDFPADAYCNLGIIESRDGNVDEAFDCFTRSLHLDASHFESHYNIGNLFFDVGELRSAQLHYHIARGIESAFPNLYFNLSLVLALDEQHEQALTYLTKYRRLVPGSEGARADDLIETLRRGIGDEG